MFRNVVWSETAESCLNKTTNNDAYGADTMGPEPLTDHLEGKEAWRPTHFPNTKIFFAFSQQT